VICFGAAKKKGRGTRGKVTPQQQHRVTQCNTCVYRWSMNFMGRDTSRGIFHPFFSHFYFQSCHFSQECVVVLPVLVTEGSAVWYSIVQYLSSHSLYVECMIVSCYVTSVSHFGILKDTQIGNSNI